MHLAAIHALSLVDLARLFFLRPLRTSEALHQWEDYLEVALVLEDSLGVRCPPKVLSFRHDPDQLVVGLEEGPRDWGPHLAQAKGAWRIRLILPWLENACKGS